MSGRWTASLSAGLGLWVAGVAVAQEAPWKPVATPPVIAQSSPTGSTRPPAATLGRPVATLGRPVPDGPTSPDVSAAGYNGGTAPIFRAQIPADGGPPAVPPPGVPAVPAVPAIPAGPGVPADDIYGHPPPPGPVAPPGAGFWGKCGEYLGFGNGAACTGGCGGRAFLQSDHAFDNFASPVTNPFEFEDPRSLTEIRPIFIFQSAPHSNTFFRGATTEFFGTQARVAITDRFSIALQKFGWVHIEPDKDSPFEDVTGFTEIDIGPKFTFWRGEQTGTVAAAGLTFEIPSGASRVFQGTGNLGLRPYLSFAQAFGQSSYGSFDLMSTFGYNFGVDNKRADNFFSSWHLDYDVANAHKIYPFLELNWRYYTTNGKAENFNFEGGDLFNLGSEHASGHSTLSLAPGVRYKFNECAQIGTAFEFPIIRRKDLEEFRWTVDLIFRY
jgi:hypothetical protein